MFTYQLNKDTYQLKKNKINILGNFTSYLLKIIFVKNNFRKNTRLFHNIYFNFTINKKVQK